MFFGKTKKKDSFGHGVFDEIDQAVSFNGTVIDGVERIEENLLLDDLCVSGSAVFMGEVDADKLVIYGSAEFREFATGDDVRVIGEAVFKNELVCESIVVPGDAHMMGVTSSDVLIVEGRMRTNHKIKTISLNVTGGLNCHDRLYADKILIKGVLESDSVVRCMDIRFTSERRSSVRHIVTDKLFAVSRAAEPSEFVLSCDSVECGTANIELTKIDYLCCERCTIGRGCVIGKLECAGKAEISPDAVVEQMITVGSEVM